MYITESKKKANSEHVNNRRIIFPVRYSPLLHTAVGAKPSIVLIQGSVGKKFAFETPDCPNCFLSVGNRGARNNIPMIL